MTDWLQFIVTVAAVGSGCVGGVFFAFSGFVMPALAALAATDGAEAMRSINVKAVRPPPMLALFGTAFLCAVALVGAVATDVEGGPRLLLIAGALLYILGAIALTAGYHVPLNNRLAAADADAVQDVWTNYRRVWTRWNWLRAAASLGAAAAFVAALQQ
jgi:uncharacterized membrane protein